MPRPNASRTRYRLSEVGLVACVSFAWLAAGFVHAQNRLSEAELIGLRQLDDRGGLTFNAELVKAVRRLDPTDAPGLITELIFLFGEQRYSYGASHSALPAVEAGLKLAQVTGDATMAATLDGLAGQMQFASDRGSAPARARILRAISAQRATGQTLPLARQLSAYAGLLQDINEFALAVRMSNEAISLIEAASGVISSLSLGVYYAHAELLRALGDAPAAIAAGEKLLRLSLQSGNQEFAGSAELALGRVYVRTGELDRAVALIESSFERSKQFADPMSQTIAALDRIDIAMARSEVAVADVWAQKIAPLIPLLDDPVLHARFELHATRLFALQKQPKLARQALDRARTALTGHQELWTRALLRLAEAEVLASEGQSGAALQLMREGAQLSVESERLTLRDVVAAQGDLYRLNERELREKQLEQDSRLRAAQLDASKQRVLTQRLVVALVAMVALLAAASALWQLRRARRFRRRAETDSLTGVCSRSAIESRATAAFDRSQRDQKAVSLLMADVDGLKAVNDSRGHAEGDALLREMSALIARSLRQHDALGRWGGDEFVALLFDADAKVATEIAERVRSAVASGLADKWPGMGTCSIGCATRRDGAESFEMTLARADAALYRAKQAGKNRVEVAEH